MIAHDWYGILGVEPGADAAQVRRAFRAAARRHHPDLDHTPGAVQRFAQVLRAWEVLGDPRRRAEYDATRRPPQRPVAPGHVVFVRRRALPLALWQLIFGRRNRRVLR